MSQLAQQAPALERAGVTRMSTWVMPTHPERNYLENFQLHADRIREIAKVLQDHNIRFGLEYVGPKTLRDRDKYAFISTMKETRALIEEIGQPNVGLVLDSFHWYTAEESVDDILTLTNDNIVACDLNDARAGLSPREQIDGQRELPVATGVVNAKDFSGSPGEGGLRRSGAGRAVQPGAQRHEGRAGGGDHGGRDERGV